MKYTYRICFFRPMDSGAVERYLIRKARKGWFLDKTGQMFWRFRRGEPAARTYAVTYFPEASIYGGALTPAQEELAAYCAAAGWEFVAQWLRMQIYVTDQPNPVPLETDERQKLETVRAVFRKNRVTNLLLIAVALLQVITLGIRLKTETFQLFASPMALPLLVCWPFLLFITLESRLLWAIWLRQSERSVEQDGPCAPSFFGLSRGLEIGALILVTALLVQGLWYAQRSGAGGALWWGAGIMAVVLACTLGPVWWMRERGYDESSIRNVTILIAVLIGVVAVCAVADQSIVTPIEPVWWYEGEEARYGIYDDPIPLRLEDLGVSTEGLPYSTSRRRFSRSPFLSQVSADHTCPPAEELPGEQPELGYTMIHVSFPPLYDVCREELSWPDMEMVEDGRWQAKTVYAGTMYDGTPALLVCWEKDLLLLYSDLIPQLTAEQAAAIREIVVSI